ncbi:MAG: M20 family peptidase [Geminicoccaceae bacterium]|nr:MAG: M20 family peptidase [Geminicoccaceae bacterium]
MRGRAVVGSVAIEPLLRELIGLASPDPPGNERAIASRVHEVLTQLGIAAECDEFAPGRCNVIGRIKGRGRAPALALSAHLDTVPVGTAAWSKPPFAGIVEGGRLYGRGTADMKSAVVAMIAAAGQLQRRQTPLAGDVVLLFTAGESSNLLGARRVVERGRMAGIGALLVGEPSSLDVVVVEMAALWLRLTAKGRIGHVSGDPGVNAIDGLRRGLNRLEDLALPSRPHPLLGPPRLTVGRIEGGSAVNVTPDACSADVDLRLHPGIEAEAAIAAVRAAVGPDLEVARLDFKPAVESPAAAPFVQLCREVCTAHMGAPAALRGVPYFSDAAVLAAGREVAFAIVGPGEIGQSGQPDESVELAKVERAAAIYAEIAARWLEAQAANA